VAELPVENDPEHVSSFIMLSVIDDNWKAHLYDLDHLKASIGFRDLIQEDADA
jgi:preprotein translocase subunit SecA